MLSRYRSSEGLALPRGSRAGRTNNPVQQFEEASEFRLQQLADRLGVEAGDTLLSAGECPSGGGSSAGSSSLTRTALRLWGGPLAGIAHQAGQFQALAEGPRGESVPQPPEDLAQALSADLGDLLGLAEAAQDVVYDTGGSESDFALLPLILEPRLPKQEATVGGAAAAAEVPAVMQPWWSVAAAVATPLTWDEVAASLGVAPELAARMQPPLEFADREAFWSHMTERHILKLEGSEQLQPQQQEGQAAAAHGGVRASGTASAPSPLDTPAEAAAAPRSAAAAMAAAVQGLCCAVSFPAVLQVMVGSEALGWNPIPLLWVGRSRRSGAILGLMTAVVWT